MVINRHGKPFFIHIQKGASKRAVKSIGKAVLSSRLVCDGVASGDITAQEVLSALQKTGEEYDFGKVEIIIKADEKEIVLLEERKDFALLEPTRKQIRLAEKIELILRLNSGNYSVSALGFLK